MSNSIKLSPKHGLNPSMIQCACCGKDMGIALFGRVKGDAEAPRVIKNDLCEDCQKTHVIIHECNKDGKLTGRAVIIPREDITIKLEGYNAKMLDKEFNQMLNYGNQSKSNIS